MYYPSYDDYMRDVFYFNGLSNSNGMFCMNGINNNQSLNNMYPSIYKIVNPVVQNVVNGNNYQFTNEENVNNIVDIVMGITAGDINNTENSSSNDPRRNNSGNNSQNMSSNNVTNNSNNEGLLRDLIKILVIRELANRNNIRRFPFSYGNMPYFMNTSNLPYMVN